MPKIILRRFETGDQGTFGQMLVDGSSRFYTCEPPWRANLPDRSCIPTGEYRVKRHESPKFGHCFILLGVPLREVILTHNGNVGGNIDKGLLTHTHGCILVGVAMGRVGAQKAVTCSKYALSKLLRMMGDGFVLRIEGEFPEVKGAAI